MVALPWQVTSPELAAVLAMPCTSAAAPRSSQLPSPTPETGDEWLDGKERSSLAKTTGQRHSLGVQHQGKGAGGTHAAWETRKTGDDNWRVFGGNTVCFLKQLSFGVLQVTQNELITGGHKLNSAQSVNARGRSWGWAAGVLPPHNLTRWQCPCSTRPKGCCNSKCPERWGVRLTANTARRPPRDGFFPCPSGSYLLISSHFAVGKTN